MNDFNPDTPIDFTTDTGIDPAKISRPKGLWYEEAKQRYRVRLYFKGRVVHRSYHPTFDKALQMWAIETKKIEHGFYDLCDNVVQIMPKTLQDLADFLSA